MLISGFKLNCLFNFISCLVGIHKEFRKKLLIHKHLITGNPFTTWNDHNLQHKHNIKNKHDRNKGKYWLWDYSLIKQQNLKTNIMRNVLQTVRSNNYKISARSFRSRVFSSKSLFVQVFLSKLQHCFRWSCNKVYFIK